MKTYRVVHEFAITDTARGRREFSPGDVVTSADVYPYEKDYAGRDMTEITAPAPLEPTPDPEP